jgi:hypothetical protein
MTLTSIPTSYGTLWKGLRSKYLQLYTLTLWSIFGFEGLLFSGEKAG